MSTATRPNTTVAAKNEPGTAIVSFSFDALEVRIIPRDGNPWFVLADVCRVLEVGNPSDAARRLDDDEKGVDTIDTLGGRQDGTVINESGLYSLILTSRKPEAKRFKKWVTSEVIPAIRRTGQYSTAAKSQAKATPAPGAAAAAAQMELINMLIDSVAAIAVQVAALSQRSPAVAQNQPPPPPQGRTVHLPNEGYNFLVACNDEGVRQVYNADDHELVHMKDKHSIGHFIRHAVPDDALGAVLNAAASRVEMAIAKLAV